MTAPARAIPARTHLKFCLAARYGRREELCGYRDDLACRWHCVTSRWLAGDRQLCADGLLLGEHAPGWLGSGLPAAAETRVLFARQRLDDLAAADAVVVFTEDAVAAGSSRGGSHAELGYALGAGAGRIIAPPVIIIGPRENLFCWLPEVTHFPSWAGLLGNLDARREARA
jgi:hypothetical protein